MQCFAEKAHRTSIIGDIQCTLVNKNKQRNIQAVINPTAKWVVARLHLDGDREYLIIRDGNNYSISSNGTRWQSRSEKEILNMCYPPSHNTWILSIS